MWASCDPCPGSETPLHWKENVVPNGVSRDQKTRPVLRDLIVSSSKSLLEFPYETISFTEI